MQETAAKRSRRRALDTELRELLRLEVARHGQVTVANTLGVSVQTLGAVAAGFEANGSIVSLIELRLKELGGGGANGP